MTRLSFLNIQSWQDKCAHPFLDFRNEEICRTTNFIKVSKEQEARYDEKQRHGKVGKQCHKLLCKIYDRPSFAF